jgi:hypothetical protein
MSGKIITSDRTRKDASTTRVLIGSQMSAKQNYSRMAAILINEPAALAATLLEGGVQTAEIVAESAVQPLNSPEDFWTIALGSGYRSVIEQLEDGSRERCGAQGSILFASRMCEASKLTRSMRLPENHSIDKTLSPPRLRVASPASSTTILQVPV